MFNFTKLKPKAGYRMITLADRIANPIVPKGAFVDNGYEPNLWLVSCNGENQTPWAWNCTYCVPVDFVFPSEKIKKSTKMIPFKAWAVVDKTDGEAIMSSDGEYVIDNHLLIYNTRKCARQALQTGERVVKVLVTEI